ncbi:hypothetical protein GCM10027048_27570 [Hymenobacter coalescens]
MTTRTRNRIVAGFFAVVILALFVMALASCRTAKPNPLEQDAPPIGDARTRHTPDVGTAPHQVDSSPQNMDSSARKEESPKLPLLQRLFGAGKTKYKNTTVQYVVGDHNKLQSASDVKNKDGAFSWEGAAANAGKGANQATDSSTLTSTGTGNAATVQGDGNKLEQTATTQEAADWKATLAKPVGIVAGLAAAGGLVYLLILWRRKRAAQNLA